jgi:DNA-binding transcriptional ArsR family regulator
MTYAHKSPFEIEERRRRVACMLARSMTESEIAQQLGVDQSTVSRDIKALKEESQQFVFNLAKSDLAYYYKHKLNSLEETKREAWNVYNNTNEQTTDVDKVKLLALKLIIAADEAAVKLLSEGPAVLTMKSLDDRVTEVINRNGGQEANQNKIC